MLFRLFLLFIIVPFVELVLLLYIADQTSWLLTLALVIVTGVVGSMLARTQGFSTYRKIQQELAQGQMPTDTLFDAVLIFVAGAFLMTPGILTDTLGFSLLIPFLRKYIKAWLISWVKKNFQFRTSFSNGFQQTTYTSESGLQHDQVIDSHVVDSEPTKQIDQTDI